MEECFWQQSTGIINLGIRGMTPLLQNFTLSLHITKHHEDNQHADGFWWNVVYFWIFNCEVFSFLSVWFEKIQDNNNIHTPCANSKKP